MKIEKDSVVSIEYTLKSAEGEVLDSSENLGPLEYIHGNGYLIPGLEKELLGKEAGEEFSAVIQPEEAYGTYDDEMVVEVEKSHFPADIQIEVGMQFEAEGGQLVTVTKVTDDKITVDANHPFAGKTLYFDVKVVSVREATPLELKGGLNNGCGGCCGGCGDDSSCSSSGCGGCCGGC